MDKAVGCTMDPAGFQRLFNQGLNIKYMILEPKLVIPGKYELCFRFFDPKEAFGGWDKGRAFSSICEIRWLKNLNREGNFRVLIIGEGDELQKIADILPADKAVQEMPAPANRKEYFLWGEKTMGKKNEYIEMRIPNPLLYPVADKGTTVKLIVKEYYNQTTREMEFYRFCELSEI